MKKTRRSYPFLLLGWHLILLRLAPGLRLFKTFATSAPQLVDQTLCDFGDVFWNDTSGTHRGRLIFHDAGQDLAVGTQRLASHSLGPTPQVGKDPAKDMAEKIPIWCPRLW